MAIATYDSLCIDAVDPHRMSRFWAAVLDLVVEEVDEEFVKLVGPTPAHTVWVNRVPEPVTVKQRLHLDVRAESPEAVEALGATVVDRDSFPWVVMKDPEGGELCVFPLATDRPGRLMELAVDTGPDAESLARWWGRVLDVEAREHEDGYWFLENVPGAPFEALVLVPVPEPKTVKNRIHVDVTTAAVAELEAAGATVLRRPEADIEWTVMADPAGNEFCAFVPAGG